MDIHLVGDVTLEDTKKAHLADLAVQEKYGVSYLQYWFNEKAGTVYCLMEAPDKESCAATHLEANGISACQIVEVEGGRYDIFMGSNQKQDHGLVRNEDGEIDNGYRYIFALNILAVPNNLDTIKFDQLKLPKELKEVALRLIDECGGKEAGTSELNYLLAVFKDAKTALKCAYHIQQEFYKLKKNHVSENFKFHIGLSIGEPLTEKEGFFTEAIRRCQRFCLIAADNEVVTSSEFEELCNPKDIVKNKFPVRTLHPSQLKFLNILMQVTEEYIADDNFNVEFLGREIGVSKAQLYRKVHALTGMSPVSFIREVRMNKALALIKENNFNVAQIALEVGYNSPSYFSKCFQEKFGCKASTIIL